MFLQQALEKALCSLAVTPVLEKHINHFTILINRTPKIVLLALDLHEHFIDEEGITIALVPTL